MGKNKNVETESEKFDVICLSHLRWDFVYQRPQHILSRFADNRRVFLFEEPIYSTRPTFLDITEKDNNIFVAVPHISITDRDNKDIAEIQEKMLDKMIETKRINKFILWFYTPMALDFADHLKPEAIIFDCMDELSAFRFAPPKLIENEGKLLDKADLVFTGGQSLYEAKKDKHKRVFAFPSSIDREHFAKARSIEEEPADQAKIPLPKFGYCGVIDERINLDLLAQMADLRPDWQFVMIGPVVKISEDDLPRRLNIHYLGGKDYNDLPAYLSNWNVALMPFAINESTRYISPTKTPEYLAAGLPVISTPIRDVIRPYYENRLVEITHTAEGFIKAGEDFLNEREPLQRQKLADEFLSQMSWDKTFAEMNDLINETIKVRPEAAPLTV